MNQIIELILITFIPALELRASIPYGILKLNMGWISVFFICIITNIVLGIIVFFLIKWIIKVMTMIKPIEKIWNRYVEKTQRKLHDAIEKYGELALAIFIGIPLPGTGVYSGALAAYFLGMDFKKFMIGNILGVLIAGIIVTIVTITGAGAYSIFMKMV